MPYDRFGTGLSYGDVYRLIWSRPNKRRHGVLGAWREIKLKMYREYVDQFVYYHTQKGE